MTHAETRREGVALRPATLVAEVAGDGRGISIASIQTVRSTLQPNVLQVIVTDSEGTTGLGETFYGASVVEAHIHDVLVPTFLADRPAAEPSSVRDVSTGYVGYSGSGAEVRAQSAIDIALWDIAAKRRGVPLRTLLQPGAASTIPVYNTCSGTKYVNAQSRQSSQNWGIGDTTPPAGSYEDLWGFLNRPGELARELLEAGYRGMKVWPFDLAAEEAKGGPDMELSFGLSVLESIREAVGDQMDLYLEVHSLMGLEASLRLATAVERFDLTWIEDPMRADQVADLRALVDSTPTPIAVGENLGAGANGYRNLIDHSGVHTVITDLGWCGGVSGVLEVAEHTQRAGMNIAYHDCTGPVSLALAGQMSLASPNTVVQEVARAFWHSWYSDMATGVPDIAGGMLIMGEQPGHGVSLRPEFLSADHTTVRTATLT